MSVTRVHHLSCITMCPRLGGMVNEKRELAIHVLAIETASDGVIVVDTGFGTEAVANPKRIPWPLRAMGRPRWNLEHTAAHRLEALGFDRADVRHIVVTHLDVDHAGGLRDFPNATVHLHRRELDAARAQRTLKDRHRYPAYQIEGVTFSTYDTTGDTLFGLDAIRSLDGVDADVGLIPLFGHSRGHAGVVVRTGDGWLLHAGDAYFHHSEMTETAPGTTGLNAFQRIAQVDGKQRHASREALARAARAHADELTVFSAHCPIELERLVARSGDGH